MNKWIQESFNLAISSTYLDDLLEIYPPDEIKRDLIVEEESPELKKIFQEKNSKKLLIELIRLRNKKFKFPIEHPYVSFLSHYPEAINKNPKTVKMIADELFKMDFIELKNRLEAPKKASRRIGPMFQIWLSKKFATFDFQKFNDLAKNKIGFLEGKDKQLKYYAEKYLKCKFNRLTKGLDFVGMIKNKFLIGTAKFITDFGGSQDNQFYEAIRFIKETKTPNNVIKIAVLDGVVWLKSKSENGRKSEKILNNLKQNQICFSALLLEKFIKNL
jgi:hypothetical protein